EFRRPCFTVAYHATYTLSATFLEFDSPAAGSHDPAAFLFRQRGRRRSKRGRMIRADIPNRSVNGNRRHSNNGYQKTCWMKIFFISTPFSTFDRAALSLC